MFDNLEEMFDNATRMWVASGVMLVAVLVGVGSTSLLVTKLAQTTCAKGFTMNPLVINQKIVEKECSSGVF